MSDNNSSASGGIGFVGLLAIAFIVLKLLGVIKWSWLWVLAPVWGGFAIGVAILVGVLIFAAIAKR
jgi:hypothetical protein